MNEISPTAEPARSRRTRYSLEFKQRLVQASFAPGASIARLAREHGLNANQLFNWRYQYRKGQLGPVSPSPLLLPVDIIDAMAAPASTSPTPQTASRLELTLAKGRLSIHGRPDPETLRLVLQVLTA
ncbi:transposase [Pseudogulbenkiania sp. MAI-1]|uniref:IS66-like element accessory protein TnpA n=1 Tax=Pseudogulbenkiania sp. MAI-1 TaxID=990370 RepID=UPI0018DC316F|nr:transposase [Pseudogulbenkiania sp. MAI-1]